MPTLSIHETLLEPFIDRHEEDSTHLIAKRAGWQVLIKNVLNKKDWVGAELINKFCAKCGELKKNRKKSFLIFISFEYLGRRRRRQMRRRRRREEATLFCYSGWGKKLFHPLKGRKTFPRSCSCLTRVEMERLRRKRKMVDKGGGKRLDNVARFECFRTFSGREVLLRDFFSILAQTMKPSRRFSAGWSWCHFARGAFLSSLSCLLESHKRSWRHSLFSRLKNFFFLFFCLQVKIWVRIEHSSETRWRIRQPNGKISFSTVSKPANEVAQL